MFVLFIFIDREQYQLGSLSHYLNSRAAGYHDLPLFPETAPPSDVRNVEVILPWKTSQKFENKKKVEKKSFYSDSEKSSSVDGKEICLIYLYNKTPHFYL